MGFFRTLFGGPDPRRVAEECIVVLSPLIVEQQAHLSQYGPATYERFAKAETTVGLLLGFITTLAYNRGIDYESEESMAIVAVTLRELFGLPLAMQMGDLINKYRIAPKEKWISTFRRAIQTGDWAAKEYLSGMKLGGPAVTPEGIKNLGPIEEAYKVDLRKGLYAVTIAVVEDR